jgi:hypothetical protein
VTTKAPREEPEAQKRRLLAVIDASEVIHRNKAYPRRVRTTLAQPMRLRPAERKTFDLKQRAASLLEAFTRYTADHTPGIGRPAHNPTGTSGRGAEIPALNPPTSLLYDPIMVLVDTRWEQLTPGTIRDRRIALECRLDTACPTPVVRETAHRLSLRSGADTELALLESLRQYPRLIVAEVEAFADYLTEPLTAQLVERIAEYLLGQARLACERARSFGL